MLSLIGDSHTMAFKEALEAADENLLNALGGTFGGMRAGMLATAGQFGDRFYAVKEGGIEFINDNASSRLESIFGMRRLDPVIMTEPLIVSFGFHLVSQFKLPFLKRYTLVPVRDKMFLSSAVFADYVAKSREDVLRFAADLVASGFNTVFVESPAIRRSVASRPFVGLSNAEVLEFDRQFRVVMRRNIEAVGARLLTFPDTRDEDGFLKSEYERIEDGHHGNAVYGGMAIREILNLADALKDRSASLPVHQ